MDLMQFCSLIRSYDKEENKNTHDQYRDQAKKDKTDCACFTCLYESVVAAASFLIICDSEIILPA
jgi:hypothetical protein